MNAKKIQKAMRNDNSKDLSEGNAAITAEQREGKPRKARAARPSWKTAGPRLVESTDTNNLREVINGLTVYSQHSIF